MPSDRKPTQLPRSPGSKSAHADRKERLAAALRANLHRRKAQSRARAERSPPEDGGKDGDDPEND